MSAATNYSLEWINKASTRAPSMTRMTRQISTDIVCGGSIAGNLPGTSGRS